MYTGLPTQAQIQNVLAHHGFTNVQAVSRNAIDEAAVGLVGTGHYANVQALLDDLISGGSFVTPSDTPKEVAKVFFDAAGWGDSDILFTDLGDGTGYWGEA